MSVKIIYFVHGTTTDNLEHKASGWNPGELSEKGIQQGIESIYRVSDEAKTPQNDSFSHNEQNQIRPIP